jgi:hypothetical protein
VLLCINIAKLLLATYRFAWLDSWALLFVGLKSNETNVGRRQVEDSCVGIKWLTGFLFAEYALPIHQLIIEISTV